MTLPLLVGGVCIITSIIGTYMVRLGSAGSIMGALYKGFWTTVILSVPAIYFATHYVLGDMNAVIGGRRARRRAARRAGGRRATSFTGMDLFWCMLIGLARHRRCWCGSPNITPAPTTARSRSIAKASADRPRHQRHPGPGDQPGIDRAADARDRRRGDRRLPAGRAHRHRLRRDRDAGAGRHGRRARRLWPGHRQCRRHRRDGRACPTTCATAPTRSTRSATPPRR